MPEKGQELFDIMDAALKRQREGVDATQKRQKTTPAKPSARPVSPSEITPQPTQPAPSGSVTQVQPIAPVAPMGGPPPQPQPADSGRVSSVYTERLSRVPDSARTAPAAGTLSPGEVLRGTVFTSQKPIPGSEVIEPVVAPDGPPQPASVRVPGSSVLRPQGGPISTVGSTMRPSGISGVSTVSGVQSGVSGPQRSAAMAGQGSKAGIFISTELAVLAVIGMTLGLVCAFFLGWRVGGRAKDTMSPPRSTRNGKTNGESNGDLKILDPNGMQHVNVGDKPKTNGKRPVSVSKSGTGKWTVEVMSYARERPAKAMVGRLARDYNVTGARIERRGRNFAVCIGRYKRADDPEALRVKRAIIAKNPRTFSGPTGIVKLR